MIFNLVLAMVVAALAFAIFKIVTTSKYTANEEIFEQAGVKVNFKTSQIVIGRKAYDIKDVQGISSKKVSSIGTEVYINVDDFSHPIHKIGITGLNDAGEKFVQRLCTAVRKAGGASFY